MLRRMYCVRTVLYQGGRSSQKYVQLASARQEEIRSSSFFTGTYIQNYCSSSVQLRSTCTDEGLLVRIFSAMDREKW